MKKEDAEQLLFSLIEQVNGNGGFKKIADLDKMREALAVLSTPKTQQ